MLEERDVTVLTPEQEDAIKFAYGQLKYLEGGPSPAESGPAWRGWRFARDIATHLEQPEEMPITPASNPDMET
jgi:hypothetical protein